MPYRDSPLPPVTLPNPKVNFLCRVFGAHDWKVMYVLARTYPGMTLDAFLETCTSITCAACGRMEPFRSKRYHWRNHPGPDFRRDPGAFWVLFYSHGNRHDAMAFRCWLQANKEYEELKDLGVV